MKELEYPFDPHLILQNRKKLRRVLLEGSQEWTEKRIAVLGGSTTANIVACLDLFLLNLGIKATFYESEYNQYYHDAVYSNKVLDEFHPDIIYIHTTNRNVLSYPALSDSKDSITDMLHEEYKRFKTVWDSISERFHCPIIQNNFEMPLFRLMGNKDASDIHGRRNYLTQLNLLVYEYAQTHDNFFICDLNYISADYGLREWSDPFYWYMYKYAMNVEAIPYLSFNISNIIKSIFGKNKKGLVLDLDNTLWGGVVGDDGQENLKIGKEESSGQVFWEFQNYIKTLKQLGIILCVDSKNDEQNAISGLNHPDGVLRPDDFVSIKANWDSKDNNLITIANELNLLPESLVFIDDNPAERHIVSEQLKGVLAPEIGESHQYIQNIDRCGFFETTYRSSDDEIRSEMYKNNAERIKLQSSFSDYGDYLDSLQMKAVIRKFEPVYLERIAQLTNKSNQFNLTTKRLSKSEIEELSQKDDIITLYGKLEDRFGDNGVVSVTIGEIEENICHIILWLMSCRVLKRDMEYAMMDRLVKECQKRRVNEIRGYYYPTAKNSMVKDFYKLMGFEMISQEQGNTVWKLIIPSEYHQKNIHIISMEE